MDFDLDTSKYGSLTINELKKELSKRGAKLSGRKQELIERLEAYERNYNFGKTGNTDIPSAFQMTTPEEKTYKDLHEGLAIPDIDMNSIEAYLTPLNKILNKDSVNLVREKFLKYIKMVQQSSLTFFKSQCKAQMKKHVTYNIDISINSHGRVEECQCDCGAGMGPEAHCKHVNAVLYALFKFSTSGVIMTEETCTQQFQTFHHVRRHQGSPIKAHALDLKRNSGNDKSINFEPRDQLDRATQIYKCHFRNVCINQTNFLRVPLAQLYAPANIQAVSFDHDYLAETPEDLFLKKIGLTSIDQETINTISMSTFKQSADKTWLELRCLRLNSSDFGRICKLTDRTDKIKNAESLTMP
ncbi:hypothetical protein SNE40_018198 [Patella caerulea]|uniref:SAP domain-containing protein n=1 Tax=Patella caerulea TaxID=87958 RepID=A0AAN8PJK3_PATCE